MMLWKDSESVLCLAVLSALLLPVQTARSELVVGPYLQNPAEAAMTVIWFSDTNSPGSLVVEGPGASRSLRSAPVLAATLSHHPAEATKLPGGVLPDPPYKHRIRITGLRAGSRYDYTVTQDGTQRRAWFRTMPSGDAPIRFTVYADSETEPESTGKKAGWTQPFGDRGRRYVVDQTTGYARNLEAIKSRQPHFVAIAGDLVQVGGEQRDWNEFWRHNAGELNDVASHAPIFPAVGNHDVYGGSGQKGGWKPEGTRRAMAKYRTYFEVPTNGSPIPAQVGRYYRIDCGPITFITLDSSNGLPAKSASDTNWHLAGEGEREGGDAPDFNPSSRQYRWLETQLAEARARSKFTFVQFHHAPYSVGPHGFEPGGEGFEKGQNEQSGRPMRVLTPLLMKYGVDAVFCGHDEMYEHSVVDGEEELPDGSRRPHRIHFFDVGIAGDGLRGPYRGRDGLYPFGGNDRQVFLAHTDAGEVWEGKRLVGGGKHYGHVEVNIYLDGDGRWTARLEPVHVFPVMDASGAVLGWERRVYEDVVLLRGPKGAEGSRTPGLMYGAAGLAAVVLCAAAVRTIRRRRRCRGAATG